MSSWAARFGWMITHTPLRLQSARKLHTQVRKKSYFSLLIMPTTGQFSHSITMWSSGLWQLMSSKHDRTQLFVDGIKADSACSIFAGKMHKFCAMKSLTTVHALVWLSYMVKPRKISEYLLFIYYKNSYIILLYTM